MAAIVSASAIELAIEIQMSSETYLWFTPAYDTVIHTSNLRFQSKL